MQSKISSRYMRKTLMPDEEIVADAHFSHFYSFVCFLALACFIALGAAAQYAIWRFLSYNTFWPVAFGLFVGLWQYFWMMLKKWSTEIVMTTQRLIYKRGFFSITAEEVDIEQLASDNVTQSFLGRIFNYGVIHFRCIEADDVWLPPVAKPYEFRNAVEIQKVTYRDNYIKGNRLRQHGMKTEDKY